MKFNTKEILTISIFIFISACTSPGDQIQGNWNIHSQEFIDLTSNTKTNIEPPDFKLLSIIGDTLYLDTQKSLYTVKDKELIFSMGGEIYRFQIVGSPKNSMALTSDTYNPDGITTVFFKRAKD